MSRRIEFELVTDDAGENLARLRRLQAAIEVDGRLDALMAANTPHEFIFAGAVLENQRASRVLEWCTVMRSPVNRRGRPSVC
jgi:hypothetical protein